MGCCYGPISLTVMWIRLIFDRQTNMAKKTLHTNDRHCSPYIKLTGWFLLNTMTTGWLLWKPMALAPFHTPPPPSYQVCCPSGQKRPRRRRSNIMSNSNYSMILKQQKKSFTKVMQWPDQLLCLVFPSQVDYSWFPVPKGVILLIAYSRIGPDHLNGQFL